MKYFTNGKNGLGTNPLMKLPILMTVIMLLLFWVVNFALFSSKMGFTPDGVSSYYLGNEELFQPARNYKAMLEITHGHLAMFAVILLLLTHLAIFSNYRNGIKLFIIFGAFGFAILSESSSWLIRYVDPLFSWLKLISFFGLQLSIFLSFGGVLGYARKKQGVRDKANN